MTVVLWIQVYKLERSDSHIKHNNKQIVSVKAMCDKLILVLGLPEVQYLALNSPMLEEK